MIKFSTKKKTQPTPPVCKGVPPAGATDVPPPGPHAQASVLYNGATTGAPVNVTATIQLTVQGTGPGYTGKTTTPNGTQLTLSGTISHDPGHTNLTLTGATADGDFFSAIGSSDAISYNPYLQSELIALQPFNVPASSAVTLAQ